MSKNDKNKIISTQVQSRWRVYIDYRKLNVATHKDHFFVPFLDKMLELLAGHLYYYFVIVYSSYSYICITPKD